MANVNNYAAAGRAAMNKNVQIVNAQAENKVRYDKIAEAAVTQDAMNRANTAKNNARIANRKIASETDILIEKETAKRNKDIRGINKQARMTGMLAGGAALLGGGIALMNKKDEPDERLALVQQQSEYWKNRYEQAGIDIAEADARYTSLTDQLEATDSSSTSTSNSSSTGGGQNSGSSSTKPISSFQATGKKGRFTVGDMTKLALDAGFSPENARVMGAIGMAESGGQAGIDTVQSGLDKNKSNEYSIGLFQVNAQAHGDKLAKLGYSEDDLRDPAKAARVAKMVYDEVGSFKPWSVYKSGAYSQYLQD